MKSENFNHINRFIVRSPYNSVSHFANIPTTTKEAIQFVKDLFNDEVFKESIFLASPELYYEWKRCIQDAEVSQEKLEKLTFSIIKYYVRSATRCTPFGLFSGYGEIQHKKESNKPRYERFTGLDLDFLYAVLHDLNKKENIRSLVKFSPNTSIYKIGTSFRYAEYKLLKNKRSFTLVEVEADEVLALIYNVTRKEEQSLHELVELLVYSIENISEGEVTAYINSLIDAQFLVSDLDICINGEAPLQQIISYFEEFVIGNSASSEIQHYYQLLIQLQKELSNIDKQILGNPIEEYERIFKIADEFGIAFDKKYLINTNLKNNLPQSEYDLSSQEISNVKKAITTLSRFSKMPENANLTEFKKAFYKRYEDQEVPLCVALDNEIGVGFIQDHADASNFSAVIDDVKINGYESEESKIKYHHKIHKFWTDQLRKAQEENLSVIDLKELDLSSFPINTSQLSQSFYAMLNKYNDKISIEVAGGTGALNLLGRFSTTDNSLKEMFSIAKEKECRGEEELLVELLHVPDNRAGNILVRNIDRDHEISFLTKGNKEKNQISLDDIYITIKHNKIVLRSKSLNKRIRVVNTTAHNFQYNALPVYQFLGELQMQDCNPALGLNLGSINYRIFKSRPRISYGNIVLSPAKWNFSKEELSECFNNNKLSREKLKDFLKQKELPRYVCLREQQDHTLWIDLDNDFMYSFLSESLKKKKQLVLEELLVETINAETKSYNTEYIIPFFKETKRARKLIHQEVSEKRSFIPGEEWLYFKLYTGTKTASKILLDVIQPLVNELKENNLIDKWHFIRFRDPEFHIRLRFLIKDKNNSQVIERLNRSIKSYVNNYAIWKVELSTYNRELERYGNDLIIPSETLFEKDSNLILQILQLSKSINPEMSWLPILKTIDNLYQVHQFTLKDKAKHINELYEAFLHEFNGDKHLKKQIEAKFRKHKNDITHLLEDSESEVFSIIENHNQGLIESLGDKSNLIINRMKSNLTSYIHMHVNRFSITNPRMHELVLYGLLSKYYKMKLGREKHVQPKAVTI